MTVPLELSVNVPDAGPATTFVFIVLLDGAKSLSCTLPLTVVFAVPEKLSFCATGAAVTAVVGTGPVVLVAAVGVRAAVDSDVAAVGSMAGRLTEMLPVGGAVLRVCDSSRRTASARTTNDGESAGTTGLLGTGESSEPTTAVTTLALVLDWASTDFGALTSATAGAAVGLPASFTAAEGPVEPAGSSPDEGALRCTPAVVLTGTPTACAALAFAVGLFAWVRREPNCAWSYASSRAPAE